MSSALLAVDSVGVQLAGRQVLHDVSMEVASSELVGLIGPNGAGKTTLLRTTLGVVPLAAGSIAVGGRTPQQARGTVGYVPQRHEFAWDFPISVERAVLLGRVHRLGWLRRPRPVDREMADRALSRVGLTELRSRPIGELSGGQRQRVLVARALALDPPLLLLDEPFTGLDMPTQEVVADLLNELRAEGRGVLMTTHDLAVAAQACTRVCLLNRTVMAEGVPGDLRDPEIWLRAFGVTTPSRYFADVVPTGSDASAVVPSVASERRPDGKEAVR